ncbi:MAG: hypothetical protein VX733_05165 [Candidatus Latescibacterota bacterium]|nr:hypothetical protein [Candidatus Latescibacterota bacterium]
MIDGMCFFADTDPSWIVAELEEGFDDFTEYKSDGGHDPATDPSASAYVHFANGVRAFFNSVKVEMPGSQYELVCDKGQLEVSDREVNLIRGDSHFQWSRANLPLGEYMQTHQLSCVSELIHILENGGGLVSPGEEARKTLEIMLGMLRSHKLGNHRVDFPLT